MLSSDYVRLFPANRWLILACVIAAGSLVLSLAQLATRVPSRAAPTGVLRRPNAYIGLEKVAFPSDAALKPFNNEDDRQWLSEAGTVVPEDHHFVVTPARSSVVQFRAMDWGMEHCTLQMNIPTSNSTVANGLTNSVLDVWELASDKELVPHVSWTAPQRLKRVTSIEFVEGRSSGAMRFYCASGSFPTFEFACAPATAPCKFDFWQDRTRSAEEGIYIVQQQTDSESVKHE